MSFANLRINGRRVPMSSAFYLSKTSRCRHDVYVLPVCRYNHCLVSLYDNSDYNYTCLIVVICERGPLASLLACDCVKYITILVFKISNIIYYLFNINLRSFFSGLQERRIIS